jgi:DNA-binding MarR family transcriptional regulator
VPPYGRGRLPFPAGALADGLGQAGGEAGAAGVVLDALGRVRQGEEHREDRSPRSVKDLSVALRLDSATLSPLLKRLEALGYCSRRRSPDDERMLTVELTAPGRDLRAEAEKIPPAVVDRLGMDVRELTDLHRVLTRVIAAAGQPERHHPAP